VYALGVATVELFLPGSASLKDKRRVIRSLVDRLRSRFNVAVAEVDAQDTWQRAVLAVCSVSGDRRYVEGLLSRAVDWIEQQGVAVVGRQAVEVR